MRRVVLVGGGYVTLHAYRQLARRLRPELRRGTVEIVVISADDCHSFHGFTGEVLAGILPFDRTRTPLTEACPRARVLHARVTHIDPVSRQVRFVPVDSAGGSGAEATLDYDQLVVGTGGREPVSTVPGLTEHGFTLRAPGDIQTLREHLRRVGRPGPVLADRSPGSGIRHLPSETERSVVVAGGGIAGVELAAAIADFGRGLLDVHLVHSGDQLLPELRADHPRLAARAEQELARLGVHTQCGVRLMSVSALGAVLLDHSTRLLPAATVLATIGQRPVQVPGLEELPRDPRGRLATRPDLSVADGIWAAGDAALVCHPGTGQPVATDALWAIKAGAHVGRNLASTLRGRPTRRFRYRGLGQAASFGLGRSIATLYGIELTGEVAWVMRMAFFLRFMPSRRRALSVVLDLASVLTHRPVTDAPPARDGIPAVG